MTDKHGKIPNVSSWAELSRQRKFSPWEPRRSGSFVMVTWLHDVTKQVSWSTPPNPPVKGISSYPDAPGVLCSDTLGSRNNTLGCIWAHHWYSCVWNEDINMCVRSRMCRTTLQCGVSLKESTATIASCLLWSSRRRAPNPTYCTESQFLPLGTGFIFLSCFYTIGSHQRELLFVIKRCPSAGISRREQNKGNHAWFITYYTPDVPLTTELFLFYHLGTKAHLFWLVWINWIYVLLQTASRQGTWVCLSFSKHPTLTGVTAGQEILRPLRSICEPMWGWVLAGNIFSKRRLPFLIISNKRCALQMALRGVSWRYRGLEIITCSRLGKRKEPSVKEKGNKTSKSFCNIFGGSDVFNFVMSDLSVPNAIFD